MTTKKLPSPSGADDLAAALRGRLSHPEDQGEADATSAPKPAARARTPRPGGGQARRQNRGSGKRPAARDLIAPVRPRIAREALKADVPAELALLKRLHRRRLDTGMDIRDQVAIALDEWLTNDSY